MFVCKLLRINLWQGTEPSNDETSPAPKVNPLRKRREHIEAVAAKIEEERVQKEEEAASAPVTPAKHDNADPDVETIDEMAKIVKSNSTNSIESSTPTPKKEIVYVKKTMKEIEEEVAINTKKFDENALKKDEKKEGTSSSKPIAAVKPKVKLQSNVQPSSIMRLIRLLLIVLLGTSIGMSYLIVIMVLNWLSFRISHDEDSQGCWVKDCYADS